MVRVHPLCERARLDVNRMRPPFACVWRDRIPSLGGDPGHQITHASGAEVVRMNTDHKLTISVTRVLQAELRVFLVLLAANAAVWLAGNNFGLIPVRGEIAVFFGFDHEWNVPTWFSVLLLVQASLLCLMSHRRGSARFFWGLLAVVFVVLSADELTSLHEKLIVPVRESLGVSGLLHFAWIIPGALFVLILAALGANWLRSLPDRTRRGFMVAAVMYLSGVLLLEAVGGWYYASDPARFDTVYWLITTVEESLEMLGLIVFGYYAALHLVNEHGLRSIRITA